MTFNEGGSLVDEGTRVGTGTLAYSSWLTDAEDRRQGPEHLRLQRPRAGQGQLRATSRKVNPSVPFWGGPTGMDTNGTAAGDRVYTYGNSSLRAGVAALSPHTGASLGDDAADGGWSHPRLHR